MKLLAGLLEKGIGDGLLGLEVIFFGEVEEFDFEVSRIKTMIFGEFIFRPVELLAVYEEGFIASAFIAGLAGNGQIGSIECSVFTIWDNVIEGNEIIGKNLIAITT